MVRYTITGNSLRFSVRVVPRASRSEVVGEIDGALRVRIAAPPVDGAANEELIKTLARAFGLAKRDVRIMGGQSSRLKQIEIDCADPSRLIVLAAK